MKRHSLSHAFALALLILLSGGGAALAADPQWDATVKAAIAEGEVNVHGGPGRLYVVALVDGFKQA